MNVSSCQKELLNILIKAGVESPGLCASMLLEHVTGMSRLDLALNPDRELGEAERAELFSLVLRRCGGEPMAYITGIRDFYEHSFRVSPATLIPRPESEMLVELALSHLPYASVRFLDAGCGCGNIGLSLLAARPHWEGLLVDISREALEIARKNAMSIALRTIFVQADMGKLPVGAESLDLLVSNPPYIGLQEKGEVMADVLAFEPHCALFSPEEGFGHLQALAREAARCLKAGALLLVEHGATQQNRLKEILASNGFREISGYEDLAGLPRCVLARKASCAGS